MAVIYKIQERRVIPGWRDYKRTLQLGELYHSNKRASPIKIDIERSTEDWRAIKNIGTAADVINSSFISGTRNTEVHEAIHFTKSNPDQVSASLQDLSFLIEQDIPTESKNFNNSILEVDVDTVNEFQAFINNKAFHKVIHKTKNRTRNEVRNPVIWVELARLYSVRGQELKAENAINTALHLSPHNRFVLRSATRFFIHTEQFEKALFCLRKAATLKTDPWLISAHIATSSIIERFSPVINDGKRLIESGNFSDFELTELASSLGTLEFKDGSFKKAKKFFEQSMLSPNDNSLAQIEWVAKDEKRLYINPFRFERVINPFEARALEMFHRGNWKEAFYNTIKWFLDMPFSKRPALLGSYIAGALLKYKNAAIILCQVGLQANPHDPSLLNNIVYHLATSGRLDEITPYHNQMLDVNINDLTDEGKITFQATLGLVALKMGFVDMGIELYELAIQNATNKRNEHLKNLAITNFANELVNLKHPALKNYIEIITNMKIPEDELDLKLMQNDVLENIRKHL